MVFPRFALPMFVCLCAGLAAPQLAAQFRPLTMNTAPTSAPSSSALTPEDQARGIWLDVRTPAEFAQGHLAGTRHIPLDVLVQHIERVVPDKTAHVRLYCRSGNRSGMALQLLRHMGYTNASNEGGYAQLKARGAQVVEPE